MKIKRDLPYITLPSHIKGDKKRALITNGSPTNLIFN